MKTLSFEKFLALVSRDDVMISLGGDVLLATKEVSKKCINLVFEDDEGLVWEYEFYSADPYFKCTCKSNGFLEVRESSGWMIDLAFSIVKRMSFA